MIKVLSFFLFLALILAGSHWLIDEKGYVLIALNETTIEGTVVSFSFLTLLIVMSVYLIGKLVGLILALVKTPSKHWSWRRQNKQQQQLELGLWAMLNQDWDKVERVWRKTSLDEQYATLRQAALVKACIEKQDWLKARTQASELELNEFTAPLKAQLEQSSETANALAKLAQDKQASAGVLQQYALVLVGQKDFSGLKDVLVKLAKSEQLDQSAWDNFIGPWFKSTPIGDIDSLYQAFPKSLQSVVQVHWLGALARSGTLASQEAHLHKLIKRNEFTVLAAILVQLSNESLLSLQQGVQQALKSHTDNTELLLSLASLAFAANDPQLAAKIFDTLGERVPKIWKGKQKQAYIADGQYQKACMI
ncbi:putative HemY (Uncharacterized enzyme of heme biosynthesis) [Pseudoalteromonas luteoviolacea B = ATCC 29581]|nr:putative HemY (Uncharacterized enzyme of heme biosynthesis) [Pseudoalteromonas luteoviolacea B = ATCC 29581]